MKLIDHIAARGLTVAEAARELQRLGHGGQETLRLQALHRTLPRRREDFERIARWSRFAVMPNDFFPELLEEAGEVAASPAPIDAYASVGHPTSDRPVFHGDRIERGTDGHHEKGSRNAAG